MKLICYEGHEVSKFEREAVCSSTWKKQYIEHKQCLSRPRIADTSHNCLSRIGPFFRTLFRQ